MTDTMGAIARFGEGERFVTIANTVGHKYYFPWRGTRRYMSLFQPSSVKGTLAALALPWAKHCPPLRRLMHAGVECVTFCPELVERVAESLGVEQVTLAMFGGTPGPHCKPTLLVESQGRVVGYCKASANPVVIDIFRREADTLEYIRARGVTGIPRATLCAPMHSHPEVWLFCQTTERRPGVRVARIEDGEVRAWVDDMVRCTAVRAQLEDTDFGRVLSELPALLHLLPHQWERDAVTAAIDEARQRLGHGQHTYCAAHGDLTPWNSFAHSGRLFAFDLEYARRTTTPYMDLFHFFTQGMLFDEYANTDTIRRRYRQLRTTVFGGIEDCDFLYRCYLLSIMHFYLTRDKDGVSERTHTSLTIWSEMLQNFNDKGGYGATFSQRLRVRALYLTRRYR